MKKEIIIFYSYAEDDEKWQRELAHRLNPLYRRVKLPIIERHRGTIPAGSDREDTIQEYIRRAQIILVLITPNYMAEYDKSSEIKQILELKFDKADKIKDNPCVIPILIRSTYWKGSRFARLAALPTHGTPIDTFKEDRDTVYLEVIYEIEKIIDTLHPPLQATTQEAAHSYRKMPPENPFFTGREELLKQINSKLIQQGTTALTHKQAIYGLGGVGKTQLAIKYAHRYVKHYQYIFWVNADIYETIIKEYVEIAQGLVLPERDEQNQMHVVEAVKYWLETHTGWLLVMDNADDLNMVKEFIPATINGHLLLTTRSQSTGAIAERIEIRPMSDEDGTLFLLRRAKKIPTGGSIRGTDPVNLQIARDIVKQLGGLPLALDQAGAYFEEKKEGLSHYLKLYQSQRFHLLRDRGNLIDSHPESVVTTFLLIFEKVQHLNPIAANVLQLCAFLAPDIIPMSLLIEHHLPTITMSKNSSPDGMRLILNEASKTLLHFSLIRRDDQASTFAIHRLVQAVLRDDMEKKTQRQWAVRTVIIVESAFPVVERHKIDIKMWPECQKLLPQVFACSKLVEEYQIAFPRAARLLNDAAVYLTEHAQCKEAEPLLVQALRMRKAKGGRLYAQSLYNQAEVYRQLARYLEAEQNLKEALWIQEQELGENHPDVALTLHSLAELYDQQDMYDKARPRYERAMKIDQLHFGPEHAYLFQDFNSLATSYVKQGLQEQAEDLYKTAAEISEQKLGKDHSYTAKIFHDWGEFCKRQGRLDEAEALHKRALAIREKTLGEDHPDTATSLHNIAKLYEMQGKLEDAEEFYKRSLSIRERVQGRDHPDVAASRQSLAKLYASQGEVKDAEADYNQALSIYKKKLGVDHPLTIQSQRQLADFYKSQQRLVEAERLYKQCLASWYNKPRLNDSAIEQCLQDLIKLYGLLNKNEQIEQLYKEAFDQHVNKLGIGHQFTEKYLSKLVELYKSQDDIKKLEDIYTRTFALRANKLNGTNQESLEKFEADVNNLIDVYKKRKKLTGIVYKAAYEICGRKLGGHDRLTRHYYYAWMEASEIRIVQPPPKPPSPNGELQPGSFPDIGYITIPNGVLPLEQIEQKLMTIEEKKREWIQEEKTREEELSASYEKAGYDDPRTIQLRHDLAELYESHGKPMKAQRIYSDAIVVAVNKNEHHPESPHIIACTNDLVRYYLRHRKPHNAQPLVDKWENFCESLLPEQQPVPEEYALVIIHYLANAATVSHMRYKTDQKKNDLVKSRFKLALKMCEERLGRNHQDTVDIRKRYIDFLKETGCNDEAIALKINATTMEEARKNGTGKNSGEEEK